MAKRWYYTYHLQIFKPLRILCLDQSSPCPPCYTSGSGVHSCRLTLTCNGSKQPEPAIYCFQSGLILGQLEAVEGEGLHKFDYFKWRFTSMGGASCGCKQPIVPPEAWGQLGKIVQIRLKPALSEKQKAYQGGVIAPQLSNDSMQFYCWSIGGRPLSEILGRLLTVSVGNKGTMV